MNVPTPDTPDRPRVPLEDRKAYLATLPWVRLLDDRDGARWCRDRTTLGHRCTVRARWQLQTLNNYYAGYYCWRHACDQITEHRAEYTRFMAWVKDNPPYWMRDEAKP